MNKTTIINFLRTNHKNFDCLDSQNFDAWFSAWEDSELDGYPHIEISSFDSVTGAPVILD